MREILLPYGNDSLRFSFKESLYLTLDRKAGQKPPLTDLEIGQAIDNPIDSPPFEELLSPGESVLIVVSDATRASGSAQVVNLLVRRCIQNGIAASDIAVIFATGIHRRVTAEEKTKLLTSFITQRIKLIDHDAYNRSEMVLLGTTERGTQVELNHNLKQFTHVVVTSAIRFHYFAGFTGGRKSICPGLSSAETIEATHMLAMDFETGGRRDGVGTGRLHGNAVHEECEAIAEMIAPTFAVNTVVDSEGRVVEVFAGHWRSSHLAGCHEYLENHRVTITTTRDVVIVSAGGWPYDINLIQAHKALDAAAQACAEGGTIILVAECSDGLGRPDFLKWFTETDSRALARRLRDKYEVNGQTAWALLTKAERYKIHLVSSLPDAEVQMMRMMPASSVISVLDQFGESTGYLMPQGAAVLPVLEG